MQKAATLITLIVATYFMGTLPLHAQFAPSTSDLWDVSNGNQVTANSALTTPDAGDMFGMVSAGSPEPGNLIFKDGQPQGFVHYVEWMTPSEMTLRSLVLNIAHDGPPRDASYRGAS